MPRLLVTTALVLLALVVADRGVPELLAGGERARIDQRRVDVFADVVFHSFQQANRDVDAMISRAHRRLLALPDEKAPNELRVFLIGNSAPLFAIAPGEIERRLAAAYPDLRITLLPLLIPDIGVVDERLLVHAALAKSADVIVLTPNLKGMMMGKPVRMQGVRRFFGETEQSTLLERPGDLLRGLAMRHWQMFRNRAELRQLLLRSWWEHAPFPDLRVRERRAIEEAFSAISAAEKRGDVDALLRVYRERGMSRFIPGRFPASGVSPDAPVLRAIAGTAREVRAAGALGVAIFLPLNPLFRDPVATRDHPEVRADDHTMRELARLTLEVYERAGFATANRIDALPAGDFIDLLHANAAGMRSFTDRAANITIRALRQLERRRGRRLDERLPAGRP